MKWCIQIMRSVAYFGSEWSEHIQKETVFFLYLGVWTHNGILLVVTVLVEGEVGCIISAHHVDDSHHALKHT